MSTQYKKTNIQICNVALIATLMLVGIQQPVFAATEAQINITATVKSVCSLTVPTAPVSLGEIPMTAFEGKSAGDELSEYSKTFDIKTNCSGTDKYTLTFTPAEASGGCMAASSGGMGFCLYDPTDKKIALTVAGGTLDGTTTEGGTSTETIKVTPSRAAALPAVGEHTGMLTVKIEPQ